MTKTICMFITNPASNDPRVKREASTLAKAGYRVVVIGLRDAETGAEERVQGYHIIRLDCPTLLTVSRAIAYIKRRFPALYDAVKALYSRVTLKPFVESAVSASPAVNSASATHGSLRRRFFVDHYNIRIIFWLNIAMAKEAVRQRADIYHAHDLDTLLAGHLAKRWTGKKLIYDFHELYTEQFAQGMKTPLWRVWYTLTERLLLKSADYTLTVCDSLGDWMVRRYGGRRAVTLKNVPPGEPAKTLPVAKRGEMVVLYHGRYSADLGLEQLIESAQYLKEGRIVLRGAGKLEGRLRELVKVKGLEHVVSFAPPVPMAEVVRCASAAHVGVLPYLPVCINNRFCLPNKLFEYMMAGLALACSDLPELRKIVMEYDVGEVFNPTDPRDLARVLNALLADETALEKRRRNALEAARTVFTWDREGQKLLRLYEEAFGACPAMSAV